MLAAGERPAPLFCLDTCTHEDALAERPHFRVRVLEFPNGFLEYVAVEQEGRALVRSGGERVHRVGVPDPEAALRSSYRARRGLRHRLLMMGADRMFTFTARGGLADRDAAWAVWKRFERLMRRRFRGRWRCVAVPELHKGGGPNDGTYHLHVAVQGFWDVTIMRRYWHMALGAAGEQRGVDSPGSVDIAYRRVPGAGGRLSWAPDQVARYLGKYLSKQGDERGLWRKRYAAAGGFAQPVVSIRRVLLNDAAYQLRNMIFERDADITMWRELVIAGRRVIVAFARVRRGSRGGPVLSSA